MWSPTFPESSHSSLVCLASERMENEEIPQEARNCLEKLWLEGNDRERKVVLFEGADESVLEIRGACVKAVIRDIDGCEKGDCSFLGYSYAKASNASSSYTIGEESSVMQSCCSYCRAKGAGWCFCDCPVEETDSYLPASYQLVQCWFSLQTVPLEAGKDLPPRKERKIKRRKKRGAEWGG